MITNRDIDEIVMPVDVEKLKELLIETKYDKEESIFLIDGFPHGFDIGYEGESHNIPFTVGNKHILWEKIAKEVNTGRYAGPFDEIPYQNYIQSPIGLVPKKGGKHRLIFHLS